MKKNSAVRVRFAPSPTGHLHIGGLRTALFNWLFARHHNGMFLVRIEDTDIARSEKKFVTSIMESLKWTGLEADEPIVFQTERMDAYESLIEKLIADGKAYRCFCSQQEIETRRAEQKTETPIKKYDGFCREKSIPTGQQKYVVRFKLPLEKQAVSFNDLIRGPITVAIEQLDDFIIMRSDGTPVYNFVVVVDDAHMNITYVIRGEDHISNTPKQILLCEALGYDIPQFAHLPLILGKSGQRLSKRDAATSVDEYKAAGYLADALINYLARLGWAHGDQEIFTRPELITYFTLKGVGKSAAIFDVDKLQWINSVYIKDTSSKKLLELILDIDPGFEKTVTGWSDDLISELIDQYKPRVKTLVELVQELQLLYTKGYYQKSDLEKWVTKQTGSLLEKIIKQLQTIEPFNTDEIKKMVQELCKEQQMKLSLAAQPLRIAIIGKSSGPGIFDLMSILGKDFVIKRLQEFVHYLHNDFRFE